MNIFITEMALYGGFVMSMPANGAVMKFHHSTVGLQPRTHETSAVVADISELYICVCFHVNF